MNVPVVRPLPSREQLTIDYFQRKRGTKRMVDMFFEFTELCTTIPPLEYGGNEVLLEYFESKVKRYLLIAHIHISFYSRISFRARLACTCTCSWPVMKNMAAFLYGLGGMF